VHKNKTKTLNVLSGNGLSFSKRMFFWEVFLWKELNKFDVLSSYVY